MITGSSQRHTVSYFIIIVHYSVATNGISTFPLCLVSSFQRSSSVPAVFPNTLISKLHIFIFLQRGPDELHIFLSVSRIPLSSSNCWPLRSHGLRAVLSTSQGKSAKIIPFLSLTISWLISPLISICFHNLTTIRIESTETAPHTSDTISQRYSHLSNTKGMIKRLKFQLIMTNLDTHTDLLRTWSELKLIQFKVSKGNSEFMTCLFNPLESILRRNLGFNSIWWAAIRRIIISP